MSTHDWFCHCLTDQIFKPTQISSLAKFLANNKKPISIAGAQFSSGGQTLIDDGIIISLEKLNRFLEWNEEEKTYVVEAGSTWEHIMTHLIKKEECQPLCKVIILFR